MENSEQIRTLENRILELENKVDSVLKTLSRIEQGIFGDEKLGVPGLIKTQASLQDQIDELKEEITELKKVNEAQDIAIKAKKGFADDFTIWMKRGFWTIVVLLGIILLITGKIGISDIIKAWAN